ncbi:MAG: NADH-quinone oxidoreductase subunit J, partial [Acidobacteria bacterium]|nr:NADH-quinone oxidoreductase subunit J [Acidobacteriota bacterium]
MVEAVLFYLFAVGVLVAGAQVIFRRNPIYGALSLVGCFFFLAGIYVLLAAHLIAILQIMVYAGAVMVLFVFVIMLLNLKEEELGHERLTAWKIIGGLSIVITTGLIAFLALGNAYPTGFLRDMA